MIEPNVFFYYRMCSLADAHQQLLRMIDQSSHAERLLFAHIRALEHAYLLHGLGLRV